MSPPRHYLDRYAQASDCDISEIKPVSRCLLDPSANLRAKVGALISFGKLVLEWERAHRADYYSRMYQQRRWINALEASLKRPYAERPSKSPRWTAEQGYRLAVQLHFVPLALVGSSIAESICKRFPDLSLEHVLKVVAYSVVIDAECDEDVQDTEKRCIDYLHLASESGWSPRKLENEIKKQLGGPTCGRPGKVPK